MYLIYDINIYMCGCDVSYIYICVRDIYKNMCYRSLHRSITTGNPGCFRIRVGWSCDRFGDPKKTTPNPDLLPPSPLLGFLYRLAID